MNLLLTTTTKIVVNVTFVCLVSSFMSSSLTGLIVVRSSTHPTIHPPIYPPIHLSLHPPTHQSVYLFIHPPNYPSTHQSNYSFIHQPTHLSNRPSIHPLIHLPYYPSIQLSIQPPIHPTRMIVVQRIDFPPQNEYPTTTRAEMRLEHLPGAKNLFSGTTMALRQPANQAPTRVPPVVSRRQHLYC